MINKKSLSKCLMSIETPNLTITQIVIQNIKTKPNAKQINLIAM
jgi:hypothetical protein